MTGKVLIKIYLARSAKLPTGLYILLALISFFFLFLVTAPKQIISSAWSIFAIFAANDRYLFVDDRSGPLVWFLKGRFHGSQLKSKNRRFYEPIYFVALTFGKGLQYRNSDFKRLDRMNFSTLCTIFVTFGPCRNPRVNNSTFCGDMAKVGISRQISQNILDLPWLTLQVC